MNPKVFLNTRAEHQAEKLSSLIESCGETSVEFPALSIQQVMLSKQERAVFSQVSSKAWIVFTSANGARNFLKQLSSAEQKKIQSMRVAVIGEGTGQAVEEYGVPLRFIANTSDSESFAEEFLSSFGQEGGDVILVRGESASRILPEKLQAKDFSVRERIVYKSVLPGCGEKKKQKIGKLFQEGRIDGIFLTSSLAGVYLLELLGPYLHLNSSLLTVPVAVIGPKTEKTVRELGFLKVTTAKQASLEYLVKSMLDFLSTEEEEK